MIFDSAAQWAVVNALSPEITFISNFASYNCFITYGVSFLSEFSNIKNPTKSNPISKLVSSLNCSNSRFANPKTRNPSNVY